MIAKQKTSRPWSRWVRLARSSRSPRPAIALEVRPNSPCIGSLLYSGRNERLDRQGSTLEKRPLGDAPTQRGRGVGNATAAPKLGCRRHCFHVEGISSPLCARFASQSPVRGVAIVSLIVLGRHGDLADTLARILATLETPCPLPLSVLLEARFGETVCRKEWCCFTCRSGDETCLERLAFAKDEVGGLRKSADNIRTHGSQNGGHGPWRR